MILAGELPLQIVWFDDAVPPTLVALTVTVTTVELADGQAPLVITARYKRVAVRVPIWALVNVVPVAPAILL